VKIQSLRIRARSSEKMLDTITASFGIALFEVGDNLETILTRADDALYQAKRSGRNQVHR
jgi:diguanylate cyclase